MKLRVKLADDASQLYRLDLPNSATLQDLRAAVTGFVGSQPGLMFSLNRKDALNFDDTEALQACGIRSGDTIWVLNARAAGAASPANGAANATNAVPDTNKAANATNAADDAQRVANATNAAPAVHRVAAAVASEREASTSHDMMEVEPARMNEPSTHLEPMETEPKQESSHLNQQGQANGQASESSGFGQSELAQQPVKRGRVVQDTSPTGCQGEAGTPGSVPQVGGGDHANMEGRGDMEAIVMEAGALEEGEHDLAGFGDHVVWFPRTLSRLLDAFSTARPSGTVNGGLDGNATTSVEVLRVCVHACMLEAGLEPHPEQECDASGLPTSFLSSTSAVTHIKYIISSNPTLPPCHIKTMAMPGYLVLYCYVPGAHTAFQPCTIKLADHVVPPHNSSQRDGVPPPPASGPAVPPPSTSGQTVPQPSTSGHTVPLPPTAGHSILPPSIANGSTAGNASLQQPANIMGQPFAANDGSLQVASSMGGPVAATNEEERGLDVEPSGQQSAQQWSSLFCRFEELWQLLNDQVVTWLLAQTYYAAGQQPPFGVTQLPQELKMLVLQSLEARDLCALAMSSNQWRHLASLDSLWLPLFHQAFRTPAHWESIEAGRSGWKAVFARRLIQQKALQRHRQQEAEMMRAARQRNPFGHPAPWPPYPGPLGGTRGITGGDYDLFPLPLLGGGPGMYPGRSGYAPGFPGGPGFPGFPGPGLRPGGRDPLGFQGAGLGVGSGQPLGSGGPGLGGAGRPGFGGLGGGPFGVLQAPRGGSRRGQFMQLP